MMDTNPVLAQLPSLRRPAATKHPLPKNRRQHMRRAALMGVVATSLLLPQSLKAGDASAVDETAKLLSLGSGVPESTAITDLVTKSASNAISSGLATFKYNTSQLPASPAAVLSSISKYKADALQKGFVLRAVELDMRFIDNAKKAASQIDLSLLPLSPLQGYVISGTGSLGSLLGTTVTADHSNSIEGIETTVSGSHSVATVQQDVANGRIFGGTPIRPENDSFEDSVALVGNNKICSGALVSPDAVITAAHCYCDGVTDEALIGTSVLSPVTRVKIDKTKSEVFRDCNKINMDLSSGDVALIRLRSPVNVAPKEITDLPQVRTAASVRAVGFGQTKTSIGFKYQVNIVIASYQCNGSVFSGIPDQQIYRCSPAYELVAAGLNRDTCSGDSGGPIYIIGDTLKAYVAGITSRGVNPNGDCGDGGIYVLLSASPIREWLSARGIKFKS
jgi:V8-like Glu-specific endopeptidase